jgi:hypothetical protein
MPPPNDSEMQTVLDHIGMVVRPALRKYAEAEDSFTNAPQSEDARQNVMLAARQAVDVLHHLSDFVLKEPSPTSAFAKIEDVRTSVETQCVFLRTGQPVADVTLLHDVADAFKHHRPDRPSATVAASSHVVPVSLGWGQAGWGEGKYGGAEQVIITTKNGHRRALSSVLQNVFDAWMTMLGQKLPPINEY